ncbi:MAG: diguanylate cyclase domain-containing protein [Lachnospiraceae bacterium]
MENQNKDRLELETKAFVIDLLASINTEDSIQNIIHYIMKELGSFTHADEVCIYEPAAEKESVERVYQWDNGSPVAEDTELQFIQYSQIGSWIHILNQRKLVVIEDKDSIRDMMPSEYDIMQEHGMKTLLLIPMYVNERMPICMGLVNPDFTAFALQESSLLFLGQQIGLLFHRERINHKYVLFTEGIRSSNLSEFIIDYRRKRYEAFRITRVLRNMIPDEGEWEWLRQLYASIIKPEYKDELLRRTGDAYLETFLCTEKSTFTIDIEREVDGNNTWFRLEFSVVSLDEEGHLERFALLVKDITQMKREEEQQQQMIKALSSFYKASVMINLPEKIAQPIKYSETAQQCLPSDILPHQVILDAYCSQMVDEEYEDIVREFMDLDTMEQRLKDMNMLSCEYHGKQIGWGRIILAPAKWNEDGSLEKVVFAVQDITEQKRREEWMQFKIEHDELTGTLNRTAFNRVTKLLEESQMPFGFVLLDIDKFKSINDTYGHDVGDEVLNRLVSVLNEKMRTLDKIFRLGGDEFAVIMNHLTLRQAECVKQIIESVNETTTLGADNLPAFSISAGITFPSKGYNETVYHNADQALYRTKETTRRGCTVFEEMDN